MNVHVVLHKCEAIDVSNHLPSGNLGIWTLSTPSASNAVSPTSHKSLQLLHMLPITPAPFCVSPLLTPLQHICAQNRNNFLLQHQLPGACTCSAPATARFLCSNARDDLARPCHHPWHSGRMSSLTFQWYLTEKIT